MRKIVVCSGAGLSVASGLQTFRCSGGLWEQYKIEDVCYLPTFLKNYRLVNEFYDARRKQAKEVQPNPAHYSIASLESRFKVINLTTNVDTLLEVAGCTEVYHLHGRLDKWVTNYGTAEEELHDTEQDWNDPKLYPVKPGVVFFGEAAPQYQLMYDTFESLEDTDIILVIGSSEEVVSFASIARYQCITKAYTVHIGPELPTYSSCHHWVNQKAEDVDYLELIKFITSKQF